MRFLDSLSPGHYESLINIQVGQFINHITVLIIDDDPNIIKLIAESFKHDFSVHFATCGATGLDLAIRKKPDVILLDVKLPDVHGYELIRQLKNNPQTHDIPVMFVSSMCSVNEQEVGFKIGAVDYVVKPIEIPLLRMRVKTHAKIRKQALLLEQLAATDSLTGIANRRKFDEVFTQELDRARREETSLSLLFVDVDNFKAYNDNYGHGKGDECLIAVSKLFKETVHRPGDFLARIGGEEFAIILSDTNESGACKLCDDIKQGLQDLFLPHEYSDVAEHVTVSIGVTVVENENHAKDSKAVCAWADSALYHVKENGRSGYFVYRHTS